MINGSGGPPDWLWLHTTTRRDRQPGCLTAGSHPEYLVVPRTPPSAPVLPLLRLILLPEFLVWLDAAAASAAVPSASLHPGDVIPPKLEVSDLGWLVLSFVRSAGRQAAHSFLTHATARLCTSSATSQSSVSIVQKDSRFSYLSLVPGARIHPNVRDAHRGRRTERLESRPTDQPPTRRSARLLDGLPAGIFCRIVRALDFIGNDN